MSNIHAWNVVVKLRYSYIFDYIPERDNFYYASYLTVRFNSPLYLGTEIGDKRRIAFDACVSVIPRNLAIISDLKPEYEIVWDNNSMR